MQITDEIYLIASGEIGISNTYDCNSYLVISNGEGVLIDTGSGICNETIKNNVEKYIAWENVKKVLCTHSHGDHSGGCSWLQDEGKEIYMSYDESEWLKNKREEVEEALQLSINANSYPKDYKFKYFVPDKLIKSGDKIKCGDLIIDTIVVKGHSPGLCCFLVKTKSGNMLFPGDYVFSGGKIGLLNCPGSDLNDYRKDFKKIIDLKIDGLFPGHRLFMIKNGQECIDTAYNSIQQVFVPETF